MINEGEGGALVEEWVELANGCICCTVKHSLVQALEQLVQRKERFDRFHYALQFCRFLLQQHAGYKCSKQVFNIQVVTM